MTADRARPDPPARSRRGHGRASLVGRRLLAAVLVGVAAAGVPSPVVASSGGGRQITDAENTRTVYLVVTVLVLLAVGLAVFTWWFWRSTRREHEALAPLEVMGDRKFLTADALARQVMLDGNRPVGAAPLAPGAPEPLMIAPLEAADAAPPADDDATTSTTVAESPAAAGDADTTLLAASPAVDDDAAATVTGDGASSPSVDDDAGTTAGDVAADSSAVDGDATTLVPVSGDAGGQAPPAAEAEPAAATEAPPAAAANADQVPSVTSVPTALKAATTPTPIDPGLPVPTADDEPSRHLSLADLAALHADAPIGFDDGDLASTPSTGIPIIESAEAWVQRQLAGGAPNHVTNGHSVVADPDDPDGSQPAAARGAE